MSQYCTRLEIVAPKTIYRPNTVILPTMSIPFGPLEKPIFVVTSGRHINIDTRGLVLSTISGTMEPLRNRYHLRRLYSKIGGVHCKWQDHLPGISVLSNV